MKHSRPRQHKLLVPILAVAGIGALFALGYTAANLVEHPAIQTSPAAPSVQTEINDVQESEKNNTRASEINDSRESSLIAAPNSSAPAQSSQSQANENGSSSSEAPSSQTDSAAPADSDSTSPIRFPTGWLITPLENIQVGTPVQILFLPDFEITARREGRALSANEQTGYLENLAVDTNGNATIQYEDALYEVDCNNLLVNIPDILPSAVCDVVYSYNATSNCNGIPLPGITGEHIEGYAFGKQYNSYLDEDSFAVPCAYYTAVKLRSVIEELEQGGYRLLVYDAYRPMQAQWALSASIQSAFTNNSEIQQALGVWSTEWYVASEPSGHNFGTDVDVGVCSLDGTPLEMPSLYDTFGNTGNLTIYPTSPSGISVDIYTPGVLDNEACLALHRAFINAGFEELASEWWHFGDIETEATNRAIIGPGGLDFVAELPSSN